MGYEADACMYVCDTYLYSVYICMYRLMKMESYLSVVEGMVCGEGSFDRAKSEAMILYRSVII